MQSFVESKTVNPRTIAKFVKSSNFMIQLLSKLSTHNNMSTIENDCDIWKAISNIKSYLLNDVFTKCVTIQHKTLLIKEMKNWFKIMNEDTQTQELLNNRIALFQCLKEWSEDADFLTLIISSQTFHYLSQIIRNDVNLIYQNLIDDIILLNYKCMEFKQKRNERLDFVFESDSFHVFIVRLLKCSIENEQTITFVEQVFDYLIKYDPTLFHKYLEINSKYRIELFEVRKNVASTSKYIIKVLDKLISFVLLLCPNEEDKQSFEHRCENCWINGFNYQVCSQCEVTFYCSRKCQKANWIIHKKTCTKRTAICSNKTQCILIHESIKNNFLPTIQQMQKLYEENDQLSMQDMVVYLNTVENFVKVYNAHELLQMKYLPTFNGKNTDLNVTKVLKDGIREYLNDTNPHFVIYIVGVTGQVKVGRFGFQIMNGVHIFNNKWLRNTDEEWDNIKTNFGTKL